MLILPPDGSSTQPNQNLTKVILSEVEIEELVHIFTDCENKIDSDGMAKDPDYVEDVSL